MRRRPIALALLLAAIGGVIALAVDRGVFAALGIGAGDPDRAGDAPDALAEGADDLSAEARAEASRLQGFPGLRASRRGTGSLVGQAILFVQGKGEMPLEGAAIEVVGFEDGREVRAEAASDARGAFTVAPLAVGAGYVLRARMAPHADQIVRGLAVTDGRATDAGKLVFGAPTSLSGAVVDGAGRAVVGAIVAVERDGARDGGFDLGRALRELSAAPGPLAQGRTEADGRFSLKGLSPGRYAVRVTHGGHAGRLVGGVYVTADGTSPDVRVVLEPGAGFEGRVLDEAGRGLPSATVVAVAVRTEKGEGLDRQETRSDADGRYRLDTLTQGMTYFVEAYLERFAPLGLIRPARGVAALDFTLTLGGRLEGRVTDRGSGQGVAGAEVLALTGFVGNGTAPVSGVTDLTGRYAFPNVIPGPILLLEVRALGYARGLLGYDAKAPREVKGGETLAVDMPLDRGGRVLGTVRGEDGRPVPYASVAATIPGDRFGGETAVLSDARGAYLLEGLRPARYTMVVTAAGYASPTDDAEVFVDVKPEGGDVARDFTLRDGATILGVVTTPEGMGASGTRVAVLARDVRRFGARVRDLVAVTDAMGGYRIGGAPPGVDLEIEAVNDAWVRTTSGAFQAKGGEVKTIDVKLRPGARILGRAVDAAGRAVPSARVRFGHLEPDEVGRLDNSFRADEHLGPRTFGADDGGSFTCDRVPPGAVLLKVEADGYAAWYRRDLKVPEEGDLTGITATLEGVQTIRGRVLDAATGRGIGGAWVYATARDPEGQPKDEGLVRALVSVESKPDGTYVLEKVPPGTHDVAVWLALGYKAGRDQPASRRESTASGATGIDFRLEPLVPPGDLPPK